MPAWVYGFIAVSVTVVWVVANIAATIQGSHVDPDLHLVMGGVVGGAWGGQAIQRRKDRESPDD